MGFPKKYIFLVLGFLAVITGITLTWVLVYNNVTSKNVINLDNIKFEDKTFLYDGESHSIEIEGELPKGISVSYIGNDKTDVGVYVVEACFKSENDHDVLPKNKIAKLEITKLEFDITFSNVTVPYDGKPHEIKINDDLPSDINVEYTGNGKVLPGIYDVSATFTSNNKNYNLPNKISARLEITKLKFSGLSLENQELVYDGEPHSILVTGNLPEGASVEYYGNNISEVGEHKVSAVIKKDNYEDLTLSATLTILKRNPFNLVFEDKTVDYDGEEHNIIVNGEIPNGVNVEYVGNGKINAGEYEIKAIVTDTTNTIAPYEMIATLIINKIDLEVEFNDKVILYDGNAHTLDVPEVSDNFISRVVGNEPKTDVGKYEVLLDIYDIHGNYNEVHKVAYLSISGVLPLEFEDEIKPYSPGVKYTLELKNKDSIPPSVEVSYYYTDPVLGTKVYTPMFEEIGDYLITCQIHDLGGIFVDQEVSKTLSIKDSYKVTFKDEDLLTVLYTKYFVKHEPIVFPEIDDLDGYSYRWTSASGAEPDLVSDWLFYKTRELITYNITYYDSDKYELPLDTLTTYNVDSEFSIATPVYNGYKFYGWYTDSNYTNLITDIKPGMTGDLVLYPYFVPVEYDIQFYTNGSLYKTIKSVYKSSYKLPEYEYGTKRAIFWKSNDVEYNPNEIRLLDTPAVVRYDAVIYDFDLLMDYEYDGDDVIISSFKGSTSNNPNVVIPDYGYVDNKLHKIVGIKNLAFSNANSNFITNLTLPKYLKNIGDNAFYNLTALEKVILPEKLTEIGAGAFENCTALTDINLAKVEVAGEAAFKGCSSLANVDVSALVVFEASVFEGTSIEVINITLATKAIKANALKTISIAGDATLKELVYGGSWDEFANDQVISIASSAFGTNNTPKIMTELPVDPEHPDDPVQYEEHAFSDRF